MRSASLPGERPTRWLPLVGVIASALIASTVAGAQPTPNAATGRRRFEKDGFLPRHGSAAHGGRAGARRAATAMNAPAFVRYVRRPFGAMPAFTAKVLPDEELADIYAYLKSLPTAVAAKDIPALSSVREK